jgi:spermidine synthase/tetratricopeptide (TPR) repeat protein
VVGQILLGLAAFLSTWGLRAFPNLMLSAATRSAGHPAQLLLWEFSLLALIVLLPGVLLGALFPFASSLLRRLETEAGAEVGRVYAWNTAGSIAGSLAAGFFLVEALGSERTLVLSSAASILLGLAGLALSPGRRFRIATGCAGTAAVLALPLLTPNWDLYRMTFGINLVLRQLQQKGSGATILELLEQSLPADLRVVFHKEGRTSTITVLQTQGHTFLRVDGKTDASTLPSDVVTQILLGQVPFFFARKAQDVCVIGYGSGLTSHTVLAHPIRRVDNIEIEKQVIEGARFFDPFTSRPLADPRSRLILEDARTALLYRPDTYDIIISVPSNPWMAGVNNLFTREFYQLARKRLNPGGILCQWVQSYEISPSSIRILQDTVSASFPHTHLFASQLSADMFLLASADPVALAPGAASLFPDRPEVRADLARIGVRSLEDLVLRYTAPLNPPPPDALLNTDDNSLIQYRAPLELLGFGKDRTSAGPLAASSSAILQLFYPGRSEQEVFPRLARAAQRIGARKTVEAIAELLEQKGHSVQARQARTMASTISTPGSPPDAEGYLREAEESIRSGEGEAAMAALKLAESEGLQGSEQNSRAGFVWLKVRSFAHAERFLDLAASDASSPILYRSLAGRGSARYHLGRREEGLRDIRAAKAMKPGDPLAYLLLGLAYRDADEVASARRELQEGLKMAPGDPPLEHALNSLPPTKR